MRVTLFMSVSMNGMIARPDGKNDFFTDVCWHGFVELARQKGGLIWGRKTHDVVREWGSFKRDFVNQPPRGVVVSRNPDYATEPFWEVAGSPSEALERLKAHQIEETLVTGGTSVNTAFIRENFVDEVILFVESVVVGAGLPLIEAVPLDVRCRPADMQRLTDTVIRLDYLVER